MRYDQKISGKITSKGQMTVPIEIRKALNIEEGDRLAFVREESGTYTVKPVKKKSILDVAGTLKIPKDMQGKDWDEIREIAHRKAAEENMLADLDEENWN